MKFKPSGKRNMQDIRIVLDTNVLVSATISQGPAYEILKLAKDGKIILVLSLDILKEFKEVISRQRFGFSQEQIYGVLKQIISISEIVIPIVKINIVIDDPDDNMVLEAAISGDVQYVVSRDKHILNLKSYQKIKIVGPNEFLDIIK